MKGFAWDGPSYSISLVLLSSCAALAAGIGGFSSRLRIVHGYTLFGAFVVAGKFSFVFYCSFEVLRFLFIRNYSILFQYWRGSCFF
jgi:hypothetical protein